MSVEKSIAFGFEAMATESGEIVFATGSKNQLHFFEDGRIVLNDRALKDDGEVYKALHSVMLDILEEHRKKMGVVREDEP